ncbi:MULTISPECIES: FUSC family protein [Grimontia]|nr:MULTISPECIES: FUSC family protein [Grimontia]
MSHYRSFAIRHSRLLYMLRVALVMGLILVIVRQFNLPYGYWALITAVTILGAIPFVGGVISKANQRIWGTVAGATVGLALFLIPPQYHWTHHLAFFGLLIGTMYFTQERYAYAALMAAITIVIVAGGGPADFEAAGWRILNVVWSAVLSILASLYVFPARATDQFIYLLESFCHQCGQFYHQHNETMSDNTFVPQNAISLSDLIEKQQGLLPHAARESGPLKPVLASILSIEKRIYTDLETLISTHWDSQQGKEKIGDLHGLKAAKEELASKFDALRDGLVNREVDILDTDSLLLMSLKPKHQLSEDDDASDISYYGYLWLNRELARQLVQLTIASKKLFLYR